MSKFAERFISSMQGLLGRQPVVPVRSADQLDVIRRAMLDALGGEGCITYPQVERRILFARDLYGLWYLRPEIMSTLSALQGEIIAGQTLRHLTRMFDGMLPEAMTGTRPQRD